MQSCIPKDPSLQTTCLTCLCFFFFTAPWNPWLLSAERNKVDLLAGACGPNLLYRSVVNLRQLSQKCWHCQSGKQALTFLKHSAAEQTFWLFETEGNSISMQSCIPKDPSLQTTCLTCLCFFFFTAPWNPWLLSAERNKVDLLAGACGPNLLYRSVVNLRQLSQKCWHWHFSFVGWAANGLWNFWSTVLTTVTFWLLDLLIWRATYLHADLHAQKTINSAQHAWLVLHIPLKSMTFVSRGGETEPFRPKTTLLKRCIFATAVSKVLTFTFRSCWPSGKQALKFWSTVLPTDLLTFWDPREILFARRLANSKIITWDHMPDFSLPSFHSPLKSLSFCQQSGRDVVAGACVAENVSTLICDSCLKSWHLHFSLVGRATNRLWNCWSTVLTTDLLTIWDRWKSHFAGSFAYPRTPKDSSYLSHPPEIRDFCQPRGSKSLVAKRQAASEICEAQCCLQTFWPFALQTTCLTFLCCYSRTPWNLWLVSAELGEVDLCIKPSCFVHTVVEARKIPEKAALKSWKGKRTLWCRRTSGKPEHEAF